MARTNGSRVSRTDLKDAIENVEKNITIHIAGLTRQVEAYVELENNRHDELDKRLAGYFDAAKERRDEMDRRIDVLEDDSRKQRWFASITGLVGGLLGFGADKVIR